MPNRFTVTYVAVTGRGQTTVKEQGAGYLADQTRSGDNWQA